MSNSQTPRLIPPVPEAVIREQLARSLSLINFVHGANPVKAKLVARSPLMEVALLGARGMDRHERRKASR